MVFGAAGTMALCTALMASAMSPATPGLAAVSADEAMQVTGGYCLPLAYYDLSIQGVGFYGCGGPTKNAQGQCNKTPVVGPAIFTDPHEWTNRDCLECGESCGQYEWIIPDSCAG